VALPPLVLRIYSDTSGAQRGLLQVNQRIGGLRASFTGMASLVKYAMGTAVVAGIGKAVTAAGDLREAQNASNVTFGKASRIVQDYGKRAAESAGLANAEALQAASSFGAMLRNAEFTADASANMSVELTQLAGDMGSLRNVDPTEMLDNIRSALAGETEPLRRYGVDVSAAAVETEAWRSGLAKQGAELTNSQKIQARYNLIMKDTKQAHGDFGETASTSLPNQLRILRGKVIDTAAAWGESLRPAVTNVLRFINEKAIPWLGDLFRKVGDVAGAVKNGLVGALEVLQPWLRPIATGVKTIWGEFVTWYQKIQDVLTALDNLLGKLADLGGAVPNLPPALTGGTGGIDFDPTNNVPGPGRQHGGWITRRRTYRVNEAGPEWFTPAVSGTVTPAAAMRRGGAGGRVAVSVSIDRRRWIENADYETTYRGF
jgi:hypothetical protein